MRRKAMFCFMLVAILVLIILSEAKACISLPINNARQQGELRARTVNGNNLGNCTHQLTEIIISDSNLYSRFDITEVFRNDYKEKISALYSLPLPKNAAVEAISVYTSEKIIASNLLSNHENELYAPSINDSQEVANRLNLYRPNKFTQYIPNLAPGEEVTIVITYFEKAAENTQLSPARIDTSGGEEEFSGLCVYHIINPYIITIGWSLFFMFLFVLSVIIERSITYALAGIQSRYFMSRAGQFLSLNRLPEAIAVSRSYSKSPVANILTDVFKAIGASPQNDQIIPELCGSARSRAIAGSDAKLRQGLRSLKTTGWLALMLGCLGTIINLLDVCRGAMVAEGAGLSAVAGGIADSFTIAMFGLLIFMPALWAAKFFSFKARKIGLETDKASWDLLDSLLKRRHAERVTRQMYTAIWTDC
jgi:biopolymer transport protein ExbB/TolQ